MSEDVTPNGGDVDAPVVEVAVQHVRQGTGQYANHLLVQADKHAIYLQFFQVQPPLLPEGQPIPDNLSVQANQIASVIIDRERGKDMAEAILKHVDKMERADEVRRGKFPEAEADL